MIDESIPVDAPVPGGADPNLPPPPGTRPGPLPDHDAESRAVSQYTEAQIESLLGEVTVDRDGGVITARTEYGAKIRVKIYDSSIPTYDYVRVWFNRRATYFISIGGLSAAAVAGAMTAFVPSAYAKQALAFIGLGFSALAIKAGYAKDHNQCLAFSFYIRKFKYRNWNLKGPEIAPRSLYQTSYNCYGSYFA